MYKREQKSNYRKYIFLILSLLWLGVIFSFSLQPAEKSGETSKEFGKMLVKMVVPKLSDELDDMSRAQLEQWDHIVRKCAHFTEYLILGVLVLFTVSNFICCGESTAGVQSGSQAIGRTGTKDLRSNRKRFRYRSLYTIGLCSCAAAVDEVIQLFVPGRSGQITDVLLDSLGACTGIVLVYLISACVSACISGTSIRLFKNRYTRPHSGVKGKR